MSWKKNAGSPFETYKHDAVATNGMVSTNHPLGSAAGLEMLAMGGNAMDAAVASAFALSVVEPMMIGIFGAGFINFYNASDGEFVNIDNYSVAPHAATPDMYETISDTWPDYMETADRANLVGYRAVGVPGALKGWCYAEERYGRLGLDTVIQPAIRYAQRGFPASQYLVDIIHQGREDLTMFPATADVFLPGGLPPAVGDLVVRADYARTLEEVARLGPDVLYVGSIGQMVVDDMASNGGIVTSDDLRDYRIHLREPVRGTYRGYEIVAMAPTSSGGTAIVEMLNILQGFDVEGAGFGTAEGVHLLAESMKIAFADRFEYMGDPGFVEVPVAALTTKEYAATRRGEIDTGTARAYGYGNPSAYVGEGADTTHLTVADGDGNVVSTTQTIHAAFGSRVTAPGYRYAAEQHYEHIRPASGQRQLDRAGQADGQQHGAHYSNEGRQAVYGARNTGRDPHIPVCAPGNRQRHRPRHDAPGGGGGSARVDAGPGSGGRGRHRPRRPRGVTGTRARRPGGSEGRRRDERSHVRPRARGHPRRGLLAR